MELFKWYYDENRIFPVYAILKHKQVDFMGRKMLFTVSKYLSSFKNMQISQVMTSYTRPDFVQYDEERYLSQFLSEMFDSSRYNSTKCALQYELNSSVTIIFYPFFKLNISGTKSDIYKW